jgi:short-subunit dehydrogenase
VLAEEGFDLLITAEDDELAPAQRDVREIGGEVDAAQIDLSDGVGVEALYERIKSSGRPVDVLALNAGIGAGGAFIGDTELEKELRLIDLNVRSTVHVAKLVGSDTVDRNEGRMLFTSSIASTMPGASSGL